MRFDEFNLDEAERDTEHAKQIGKEFRRLGYKKIGSGADATVWAKDASHVIKILMPDEPTSTALAVFKKFYEFCQEHQNVDCLPAINEYNSIDILGKEYTQIDMERLYPIKKKSFEEGVVWFFSDFIVGDESWDAVDYALGLTDTWTYYNKSRAMSLADMWQSVSMANGEKFNEYKTLYKIMDLLYSTGRINKFGWDLHTENVMQRADGTLVIIDPWFNMSEKSV